MNFKAFLVFGKMNIGKIWVIPASFSFFSLLKQLQFLQQRNVKNVHPAYGAGI